MFGNSILCEQNHGKTITIPPQEQNLPLKRFRSSNYCCGKPWLLFSSFLPIRVIQISDGTGISHGPRHAHKTKVMWLPLTSPDTITPRSYSYLFRMFNLNSCWRFGKSPTLQPCNVSREQVHGRTRSYPLAKLRQLNRAGDLSCSGGVTNGSDFQGSRHSDKAQS